MAKWLAAGHSRTDCSGGGSGRALRDDNAFGANATPGHLAVSKNLLYVLDRYLVFLLTIGLWSPSSTSQTLAKNPVIMANQTPAVVMDKYVPPLCSHCAHRQQY